MYRFKIRDWLQSVPENMHIPCLSFLIAGLAILPPVHNLVLVKRYGDKFHGFYQYIVSQYKYFQ